MDFFPQTRKNISELWDNLTDDMFSPFKSSAMRTDIYEKDGNIVLETELPGFNKENISVDYKNEYLTITAKSKYEAEAETRKYLKRERTYGEYVRRFYVDGIDKEKINASFKEGILKVAVPKPEAKQSFKTINID
ncbi:Hsp20/alpha crystallin family protein [Mycoplasmatota bacterium zrk1]